MKARFDNGEGEGAHKEQANSEIEVSRRGFIKTTAAFGAAVAGVPYNLIDIGDIAFKKDEELIMYPAIYEFKYDCDEYDSEFKYESQNKTKLPLERFICIKTWGCNWNCRRCSVKETPALKDAMPMRISINQITDILLNFGGDTASTTLVISGGEPLIQKEEALKLIESLKTNTNYTVMICTNGSLIEEDFINRANYLGLNGIIISFYGLNDKWHRWYTGHSNKVTINALKLVTERFKGLTIVSVVPFNFMDTITFENMCKFLSEINPNFVIQILCPLHEAEGFKKRRLELEEIALRYFNRMDRAGYFSKQVEMIRYQIEEGERNHELSADLLLLNEKTSRDMNLVKTKGWKLGKEARGYG